MTIICNVSFLNPPIPVGTVTLIWHALLTRVQSLVEASDEGLRACKQDALAGILEVLRDVVDHGTFSTDTLLVSCTFNMDTLPVGGCCTFSKDTLLVSCTFRMDTLLVSCTL